MLSPSNAAEFQAQAKAFYEKYLELQVQADIYEDQALIAGQGDERAAAFLLKRKDTQQSFDYAKICANRDMMMNRAQVAATMAFMTYLLPQPTARLLPSTEE